MKFQNISSYAREVFRLVKIFKMKREERKFVAHRTRVNIITIGKRKADKGRNTRVTSGKISY